MFRFSEEYFRSQSGLYQPQPIDLITDPDVVNEYAALVESMSEDFKAGRVTDLLLDDRDIKKADNFVDFYYGEPGLDDASSPVWTPFPKQIQAATNTLQEHCTNTPGRFQCTDMSYVQNIPTAASIDEIRSKITFLKHGKCPTCGKTRLDQWNEKNQRKDLLAMAIGQRAGKDRCIALIGAYLHHGYLTLRNLSKAYLLGEGTNFFTTFTATTQTQALKATFGPFLAIVNTHPWFKKYHEMLGYSGQKAGRELFKIGQEGMAWPHHGLAVTVEAPNDKNLRGSAKIYGSITEVAYFYSNTKNAVKLDANQIFKAMNNSFGTIKMGYRKCVEAGLYDMPQYLFANASSPRANKDRIMTLVRTARTTPTMYAMHCSTFEFNPDARESDYETERATDPAGYRTDILALPADAVQGFIKSRRLVSTMLDEDAVNGVACKSVMIVAGAGLRMTSGKIRIRNTVDKETPKIMGIDAGLSFNSFAGVIAHVEMDEDEDTGEEIFYTVVDAVFEVIPKQEMRINLRRIYDDVIRPLCEELNVKFVVADRWESTRFIDDLAEDLDIQGHQHKCSYSDFLFLRSAIDDKRIILPKSEVHVTSDAFKNVEHIFTIAESGYPYCFDEKPIAHLLYQLLTVEDIAGKTVDKGENSTDDTFRSLVLAHKFCHDPELRDSVLGVSQAQPNESGFEMVSVGLDARVMDKKSFATSPSGSPSGSPSDPGQESFGIIVPFK